MKSTGIILLAHGARDPAWARPFEAVRDRVAQLRPEAQVVLAFLEFMSPPLPLAAQQLAAHGCTDVQIVPLFLGAGGHVRKDLPPLIQVLAQAHPGVHWTLQPAIGEHPDVIAALADAAARSGHRG
jgi:sirohydrochlorin cobaltochelatase